VVICQIYHFHRRERKIHHHAPLPKPFVAPLMFGRTPHSLLGTTKARLVHVFIFKREVIYFARLRLGFK
jgi:hypothetical protein